MEKDEEPLRSKEKTVSRTYLLIIVLFLSFISTPSFSEELNFLFSVDQNVKSEDFSTKINPEKDISNNDWFASPATRLELFTFSLDQYFRKEFEGYWERYVLRKLGEYFEEDKLSPITARASAEYIRDYDIFVVGIHAEDLGRPRKPMKECCDEIINSISPLFAGGGGGYLYQNTILRPFIFGKFNDPEVLELVDLLSKNMIVVVSLAYHERDEKSQFPTKFYSFKCYRFPQREEVYYLKQSFPFKGKP